jgi:3',5'-cyclic AMP phosphodiesterase CpdA
MKKINLIYLLFLILLVASCAKDQWFDPPQKGRDNNSPYNLISPKIKIAVISDIHYLDPALMPDDYLTNVDFQKKMTGDRKLIELSDPIFRKTVEEVIAERPDILMIPGDLSFNGEYSSHLIVKEILKDIEDQGIKVFVIPGNNDIWSTEALNYKTIPASETPNISLSDFADIYNDFGYNDEALYRDLNSLSYICQPFENLWILGIDAFSYTKNTDGTYTCKAKFNAGTMAWIQEKMIEANEKNITVLAMLHSGIVEHYTGQKALEGGYVSDYQLRAAELLNSGIRLVFNGHHHGNDITNFTVDGKTLVNIETGSLVTPLSPFRIMTLDDNFIKIETRRITDIDAELPSGMDFLSYSDQTIMNRLNKLFVNVAMGWFGQTLEEAKIIAPFYSRAWMAHFAGDEKISPEELRGIEELKDFTNPALITAINSIWTDLPPFSDNKIHIKLK